jgi:energy-coupling factor transporter transmembrane protein EcfT
MIPLLVPMFVSSLKQSERIALAMDARAYGIEIRRTSLHPMKFAVADWCVLFISLFIMVVPLFFNF